MNNPKQIKLTVFFENEAQRHAFKQACLKNHQTMSDQARALMLEWARKEGFPTKKEKLGIEENQSE